MEGLPNKLLNKCQRDFYPDGNVIEVILYRSNPNDSGQGIVGDQYIDCNTYNPHKSRRHILITRKKFGTSFRYHFRHEFDIQQLY